MPQYKPLISEVRLSQYGYWVISVSVAPDKRIPVMMVMPTATREEAESAAVTVAQRLMGVG